MSRTTTTFGDVLRQLRLAAGLSQEALAECAGVSVRGISDLERGARRTPHLTTVRLLADALELGPADRQTLLAAARPGSMSGTLAGGSRTYPPLPIPLTALLGRERELATLVSLLGNGDTRLVTLTGPGGTGKTRLALDVGAHLQGEFGDGVVFVDLAPLAEPALVLSTIATAVGVRERLGQRLMDTLAGALASKRVLLLLDNCEQVLGAAPDIATLLAVCPQLSVLATSREALRVRGGTRVPAAAVATPRGRPPRFR